MPSTHSADVADLATAAALSTVDTNVDAILVDTGTTLPTAITTVDTVVDAVLVDTAAISTAITTVDTNVDAILVDTGTTLPTAITTVDTVVDAVLVDTAALDGRLTATRAGYLDQVNGVGTLITRWRGVVAISGGSVYLSSSSTTFVDVGATCTMPAYTGDTFYLQSGFPLQLPTGVHSYYQLHGGTLGDQTQSNVKYSPDGNVIHNMIAFRSGYAAGEVGKIQVKLPAGTLYVQGEFSHVIYQESAL